MGWVDIVKAALDIEKEGGDLKVKALEEADLMGESRGGIEYGKAGEGAGLVGVEEATGPGQEGESGGGDTFKNLGESFQEDDDSEGGRRVVRGLARLI